jgi:hypothetical protein
MIYLTSINQNAIIAAEAQISINCRLPNEYDTLRWDIPLKSVNEDLWFIIKPFVEGWGNSELFTQAQMMDNVDMTDIIESEYNDNWFV